jgi:hypothetical protein
VGKAYSSHSSIRAYKGRALCIPAVCLLADSAISWFSLKLRARNGPWPDSFALLFGPEAVLLRGHVVHKAHTSNPWSDRQAGEYVANAFFQLHSKWEFYAVPLWSGEARSFAWTTGERKAPRSLTLSKLRSERHSQVWIY